MDHPFHSQIGPVVNAAKEFLEQFANQEDQSLLDELGNLWRILTHPDPDDSYAWNGLIAAFRETLYRSLAGKNREAANRFRNSPSHVADDSRFSAREWDHPFFDFLRQAYLLFSDYLIAITQSTELPPDQKKKHLFAVKLFLGAISPSNYLLTNPEVIKRAVDTNGKSLQKGLENCLADIQKGRISTTDESAFRVGGNIAATPGSVIYENNIMQLIQYQPTMQKVSQRPIVMVPPCVNKYYILDLQRHNSLVRYCLDNGHQVFCMSWINPGTGQGKLSWEDYLRQGVLTAMDIAGNITGSDKIHTLGWCIGGTLLATALAVRNDNGKKNDISSATFITTMLDFSDPGDLGIFLNETPGAPGALSENIGVISGEYSHAFFSLIKAHQLIWPYLIKNYLKGETPAAFDFLYWNSDSTNLPVGLYMDFVHKFYKQNALITPGGLTLCGVPIDLGKINTPSYFLSTMDDHIIPWQATFPNTRIFSGHTEFVLGSSGHVAGVINPPDPTRRNHWRNGETDAGPAHWLNTATSVDGSWWVHWLNWIKKWDGEQVAAPKKPGNETYREIESAPGRYVKKRANLWNLGEAPHE